MKSIAKKILVALAVLGIVFSGTASADAQGEHGWWKNDHQRKHHRMGSRAHSNRPDWWREGRATSRKHLCAVPRHKDCRVVSDIFQNAKVGVLSDLSGKSRKQVRNDMKNKPNCLLLEEYKIKASDFYAKLKTRKMFLLNRAVKRGKLTEKQKEVAIKKMNKRCGHKGRVAMQGQGCGCCR